MEKEKPKTRKEIKEEIRRAEFIAKFKDRERQRNAEINRIK